MSMPNIIDVEEQPLHGHIITEVTDERGITHEAVITTPKDPEKDIKVPVFMIGGVPRGGENSYLSPHEYHPYLAEFAHELAESGVTSMVQSPAGVGSSNGDTLKETMATRISASVSGVQKLLRETGFPVSNLCLLGNSMGAYIALGTAEKLDALGVSVAKIVLLSPATYDIRLENTKFSDSFAQVIEGQAADYEGSRAIEYLSTYEGKLMTSYLKSDIPKPILPEVKQLFDEELDRAYLDGRGFGRGYLNVGHSFRALSESGDAKLDTQKALAEAAKEIAHFITKF